MNDQEHKCKCDFRIRMLGDGCRYCHPQKYIDRLYDTMDGMIYSIIVKLNGAGYYEAATMLRQQQAELEHMRSFFGCDPAYYGMTKAHPVKELTDEEINVVAILQDAEIVPVGHEIWKTGEEFNKYKRIVLATAKALRKAQE